MKIKMTPGRAAGEFERGWPDKRTAQGLCSPTRQTQITRIVVPAPSHRYNSDRRKS